MLNNIKKYYSDYSIKNRIPESSFLITTLLLVLTIAMFIIPHNIISGGAGGVALLIREWTGISAMYLLTLTFLNVILYSLFIYVMKYRITKQEWSLIGILFSILITINMINGFAPQLNVGNWIMYLQIVIMVIGGYMIVFTKSRSKPLLTAAGIFVFLGFSAIINSSFEDMGWNKLLQDAALEHSWLPMVVGPAGGLLIGFWVATMMKVHYNLAGNEVVAILLKEKVRVPEPITTWIWDATVTILVLTFPFTNGKSWAHTISQFTAGIITVCTVFIGITIINKIKIKFDPEWLKSHDHDPDSLRNI